MHYKVHPSTVNKFFFNRLEEKAVLCFLCVYLMVLSWRVVFAVLCRLNGESEFSIGHAIKMGIKCVMTKINKRLKVNGAQKKKIYNELC